MTRLRSLTALGAVLLSAGAVTACGGDNVPGNAVVRVGDQSIKKDTFDHWMRIASISQAGQANPSATTAPKANIPDAPDFERCVAMKRTSAPKPAKGQPQQTDAQFKTQCKQENEGLRDQVMQFPILEKWVNGEAADQGVKVSAAQADKQFADAKKQSFPKEKDFQAFLRQSGMT